MFLIFSAYIYFTIAHLLFIVPTATNFHTSFFNTLRIFNRKYLNYWTTLNLLLNYLFNLNWICFKITLTRCLTSLASVKTMFITSFTKSADLSLYNLYDSSWNRRNNRLAANRTHWRIISAVKVSFWAEICLWVANNWS